MTRKLNEDQQKLIKLLTEVARSGKPVELWDIYSVNRNRPVGTLTYTCLYKNQAPNQGNFGHVFQSDGMHRQIFRNDIVNIKIDEDRTFIIINSRKRKEKRMRGLGYQAVAA